MRDGVLIIGGVDCSYLAAIREHRKRQVRGHEASLVKLSIEGDKIHGNGGRPPSVSVALTFVILGLASPYCAATLPLIAVTVRRGAWTWYRAELRRTRHRH